MNIIKTCWISAVVMRQLRNAGNLESILSSGESAKFDFIQANENT